MIGKNLGHYEICGLLGQGGMGTVYRARDLRLERDVALKILHPDLVGNEEFHQRFEREVRSLAALRHPDIVTIHSVEKDDGVDFYTMEFIAGSSLDAILPKKGFPLDQWFRITIPLADALGHAHAQGVTHRDLKPTNIMLGEDGTPKILDFGLAKLCETGLAPDASTIPLDEFQTGEGRILGTAAYMSPEQAEGKPADHRSDVFSLGIVLYEMATGQKPFSGDTPVSTVSAIIKDTPDSITSINQRLPRHLWRIVKKCLEKAPGRRYQSVVELKNDLVELKSEIDSGELAASPMTTTGGARGVRRWLWPALAIAVAAALGLGYGLLSRSHSVDESSPVRLGGAVDLTRSGKVSFADLSPDGRFLVYNQRDRNLSSLRVLQLATGNDVEILAPKAEELESVHVSNAGDHVYYLNADRSSVYRVSLLGGDPQLICRDVIEYALAPDDRHLAVMRPVGSHVELWLRDISSGEERLILDEIYTGFSSHLSWSCDGESIVFNALRESGIAEELLQVSVDGGRVSKVVDVVWGHLDAIGRLRDGSGLIVSAPRSLGPVAINEPSELWFIPAAGGEHVRLTQGHFDHSSIGSDLQGGRLTTIQRRSEHTIWVMDMANPEEARQLMYTSRAGRWWLPLTWTRDSRILYPGLVGGDVHIWEIGSDGSDRRRITTTGTFNLSTTVSPDGRTIAYSSNLDGSLKIYLMDREGGVPRRLTNTDDDEFMPQFSPDGLWVAHSAFTARESRVCRTSLDDGRTVELRGDQAYVVSYSPDGLSLACLVLDSLAYDGRLTIISAEDGRTLRTLPNKVSGNGRIRWTPDGQSLVYPGRKDDVDNLWLQPLEGGDPRQLTRFTSGTIAGFALSTHGDSLAVAIMDDVRDVVMFEDYRGQIERALGQTR